MSVGILKLMLKEARTELGSLVRQVESAPSLPAKALAAIQYSHRRMAEKISQTLEATSKPLNWRQPESGTWRANYLDYDITVYKEAGVYHWQVNCKEDRPAKSFDEAEDAIIEFLGLR